MRDYKKILEDVVNIVSTSENSVAANIRAYIDENCPELKEDEDERIIKALKEGFKYHQLFNPTFGGIPCKEIVNWLEKQGKKRKITHEEICKSYGISDIGEFSDGYHTFNSLYKQRMILFAVLVKTYKDRAWKSWKHEDGLDCFGGGWFIVGIDTPAGTYTYHYEAKDWDRFDCRILDKAKHWDGHDEFDVERLFSLLEKQGGQKPVIEMKSAEESLGIDSETYSKIVDDCIYGDCEQRPADKAEPKFKVGDKIRRKTPSSCDKDMQVARIEKDYYICNHIGKFSSEVVPFSKESSYELIEQKPAWSEEDEKCIRLSTDIIDSALRAGFCVHLDRDRCIDWLKSIKERVGCEVNCTTKKEWSEEDEKRAESLHGWLDTLINYIHHDAIVSLDLRRERMQQVEQLKTWLKSLQLQNTWKPNNEQMKILLSKVEAWTKGCPKQKVLESLYNDLKKLK